MGRTSPMAPGQNRTPPTQMTGGPPPINTGAPVGYPPNMNPMGQMPPGMAQGGPPQGAPGYGQPTGYPPGPPPAGGPIPQQFQQNNPAAEVEGASRSKAQLIVGIDFVSSPKLSRSWKLASKAAGMRRERHRGNGHGKGNQIVIANKNVYVGYNLFWCRLRVRNQ
jgi:hypothetical protein